MSFKFTKTKFDRLIIIEPDVYNDNRGTFQEIYRKSVFIENGIDYSFIQDNYSKSYKGVIRGLHFQNAPYEQGKLVRVTNGRVWDVVVDLRKKSSTFLKWFSIELSETNNKMLFIPPGFAHGFLALSDNVHLHYKTTKEYNKNSECGIRWDDPDLKIDWPTCNPTLSENDSKLPYIKDII